MVRVEKPESTDDSVCIPACEERGNDGDKVRKYWHSNRKGERHAVYHYHENCPSWPALVRVLIDMTASAEEADEDKFCSRVGVQRTRYK